MKSDPSAARRDPALMRATRGAGLGVIIVLCTAILVASIIAGHILLVEFFPASKRLFTLIGL